MTPGDFRSAIAKGQGRAVLAVEQEPSSYADAIIEACLRDLRFDPRWDEQRAPYLHHIVSLAGLRAPALDAILASLPTCGNEADRTAMIELLSLFAREGDARAFDALIPFADAGHRRAQDGLATSGDPGLEWVVEHILPRIPPEEQGYVWVWLTNGGWDDRTPTRKRLRIIREEAMARRASGKHSKEPNPYFLQPATPPSPEDEIWVPKSSAPSGHFWIDGEAMFDEGNATRLRSLVGEWRPRKMTWSVKNLIPMPEGPVRSEPACVLLGEIDSPNVREFGLELIGRTPILPRALHGLTQSARPEDIPAILDFLRRSLGEEDVVRNAVAMDAEGLARAKWERPWQPLVEWAYEHALSSSVRSYAFDWMIRVGKLSRGMVEEARHDAEADTREQADERSRKPPVPFMRRVGV